MGLLNIYDRIMDESRSKQVEGILGSAATTSPYGPMQPTGLLGGQIDPLIAATRIQEVGGNTFDPIAQRVMQQQQQATQAQYQAMMQQIKQNQPTTMQRNVDAYTQGFTPEQRQQLGRDILKKPASQISIDTGLNRPDANEAKQIVQQDISEQMFSELETLMQNPNNLLSPTGNALFDLQTMPVIGDILQRYNPATKDQSRTKALTESLSNTLLQAMRGAQVGPKEQERFDRQLPRNGQSPEQFKANFELTRRNIQNLRRGIVDIRKLDAPENPLGARTPPKGFTEQM